MGKLLVVSLDSDFRTFMKYFALVFVNNSKSNMLNQKIYFKVRRGGTPSTMVDIKNRR